MRKFLFFAAILMAFAMPGCSEEAKEKPKPPQPEQPQKDAPALKVSPNALDFHESSTSPQRFLVSLNAKPQAPVTITATLSDNTQFSMLSSVASLTEETAMSGFAFYGSAIDDGVRDGDQAVTITFTTASTDAAWNGLTATVTAFCIDDGTVKDPQDPPKDPQDPPKDPQDPPKDPQEPPKDPQDPPPETGTHIRLVTANATSGDDESYDPPASQRILMALNADIVMLQEFKILKGTGVSFAASKEKFDEFVSNVFGPEFEYFRGTIIADKMKDNEVSKSAKPNGIISRYPIIESGEWQSQYEKTSQGEIYYVDSYYDRQWTWAVIDIPGDRDLLAVSVHLHTNDHAKEFNPLAAKIAQKQQEGNYYVVLGGDFNTKEGADGREAVLTNEALMDIFYAKKDEWPVDQKGSSKTNNKRGSPLDWVLFSHDLEELETPTVIGTHSYAHGHVFDTRVYEQLGEIATVPPAEAGDTGNINMQHLPVIRDILIP